METDENPNLEEWQETLLSHLKTLGVFQPLFTCKEKNQVAVEELYTHAYHFYNSGKFCEAADFFRVLTNIDSENKLHWMGLGASTQMQQLYHEALIAYSTAAILDSSDPVVFFHAANCCFALKQIPEGIKALDAAETIAANDSKYTALLSQLEILKQIWSNNDEEENNKFFSSRN